VVIQRKGSPIQKALNEILIVDEAADILRIPGSTVCKLAQLGKIPSWKGGWHCAFIALPRSIGSPAKTIRLKRSRIVLSDFETRC
jgi:hypothetical protein